MATLEAVTGADRASPANLRHIVLASVLGTTVEWYDFLIYGVGAALVFNKLFFPSFDPLVGTLAAFGSYAVGFVARPLGGAIFGHYGDRLGRKAMLTLTMIIMGGGTFLIGLLPTYEQIGIFAPVLLIFLRLLQGIGIGGEWGGAVLMVIESGDPKRRGFLGSLVQVGFPLGMVLATIVFAAVSKLPESDFLAWGWRVPFLISFVLVGVGMFVRLKLVETPKFRELQNHDEVAEMPIFDVLRRDWRNFLIAVGLKLTEVAWVYILTVFIVFYAASRLGLSRSIILDAVLRRASRADNDSALWDPVGQDRAQADVRCRRDLLSASRVSTVRAPGHQGHADDLADHCGRDEPHSRSDVRPAGRFLARTLRHEGSLQRGFPRLPSVGSDQRRVRSLDRDRLAHLGEWNPIHFAVLGRPCSGDASGRDRFEGNGVSRPLNHVIGDRLAARSVA